MIVLSPSENKIAILHNQSVNIISLETLELKNKVNLGFLKNNGKPVKITNILFLNGYILVILTIDNELMFMDFMKNEIVYREKIENMRQYGGQLILFNKQLVMNKMNKLIIAKETSS